MIPVASRFLIALVACISGGLVAVPAAGAASSWFLSNDASGVGQTINLGFGDLGDVAIKGDWNGDGTDTPGVFRQRAGVAPLWLLSNSTTGEGPLISFGWGNPTGDVPIVGDWNGDGVDTVGIFRPTAAAPEWYLATSNAAGGGTNPAPITYGNPGDKPVVGDWDGDGTDTIGIEREVPGAPEWHLASSNVSAGGTVMSFTYGNPGDQPLAGDWNGDRTDTVAIFRVQDGAAVWAVAASNTPGGGAGVRQFPFGSPGDAPVAGDWNGDGRDTPGVMRGSLEFVPPPPPAAIPKPAQANGQNASRLAKLTVAHASTSKRTRRVGFSTTPVVNGKLVAENGAGIGNAIVIVLARRRQFRAATSQIDTLLTAADGSFSYRLAGGPSRTVTFAYTAFVGDPQPAASESLRTLVRASVTAGMTPNAPRPGRLARLSGRLRYLPRAGIQVIVQGRNQGVWRPVATVKTRAGGRYTWRYRFKPTDRGRIFRFRAHVDSPVYPFTPGNSREVNVRVR